MSLYNLLYGENPWADLWLAMLGLSKETVGRYRDCYLADDGGRLRIHVYTRNGGGNRNCFHVDHPEYGDPECKSHPVEVEIDELLEQRDGCLVSYKKTGRRVMETRHVCEAPSSEHCACYGCVIEHRLPKHPQYVRSRDDDFDCTYATIYFDIPPAFADLVPEMARMAEEDHPAEKWEGLIDRLRRGDTEDPATAHAVELGAQILGAVAAAARERGQGGGDE